MIRTMYWKRLESIQYRDNVGFVHIHLLQAKCLVGVCDGLVIACELSNKIRP